MKHVMLDLETLSSTAPGVILSVGAVEFNQQGLGKDFYYRVDVGSSLLHGLKVDYNTVAWWNEQSEEAKEAAFYYSGAVPLERVLYWFSKFVDKDTLLWAKGPDFDCVMLHAAYTAFGMKIPWSYRNTRDVRTMLALSGVKEMKGPGEHNALFDARMQAQAVVKAYEVLDKVME